MEKKADAEAIPFAGTASTQASVAPIAPPTVDTKPAAGQTGPKGMAPRTNYSRVNTGAMPTADAGATAQKSVVPDAQSFLPPKVAHSEVPMNVTNKMTLQQMIKSAAAGVNDHAAVLLETERRAPASTTKVASAPQNESVSTEYAEKLASAVEYLLKEATAGEGPNHLDVSESNVGGKNPFVPGAQGHATEKQLPPKNPGTFKPSETPTGPATALDTNNGVPGKQKVSSAEPTVAELRAVVKEAALSAGGVLRRGKELVTGSKARSLATDLKHHEGALPSAIRAPMESAAKSEKLKHMGALGGAAAAAGVAGGAANHAVLGGKKEASEKCPDCDKEKDACTCSKTAGAVDTRLVDALLNITKQAEDAINPAHISAGPAVPPETSEAGQPGGAPAGGPPQGATGLVASNEAAINYNKGQAKADQKRDVNKILTEPALSSAHDNVLQKAFAHTGEAGTKMSSDRTLAARAVIEKMASEAEAEEAAKKKKKESAGFSAPPVGGASGAGAGAM